MILETKRLYLRIFENSDLMELARIYADEEVMRYIGRGGALTTVQTLRMLEHWKQKADDPGYAIWAVINKENDKLIGHCGFQYLKILNEIEIAYLLDKPYWDNGLASEISQATLDYGFKHFELKKIIAVVYPENKPSIRVIEKMEMKFLYEHEFYGKNLLVYGLTKKKWEKKNNEE
jgi:RimJ/RimL family protein N-acetyltransferase